MRRLRLGVTLAVAIVTLLVSRGADAAERPGVGGPPEDSSLSHASGPDFFRS